MEYYDSLIIVISNFCGQSLTVAQMELLAITQRQSAYYCSTLELHDCIHLPAVLIMKDQQNVHGHMTIIILVQCT